MHWRIACMALLILPTAAAHEGTILFQADDGPYDGDQWLDLPRLGPHVVGLTLTDGNGTPIDGLDVRLFVEGVQARTYARTGQDPADVAAMDNLGDGHYRATIDFAAAAAQAGAEGSMTFIVVARVYDADGPTDDLTQIPYHYDAPKESPGPGMWTVMAIGVALLLRRHPTPEA